MAIFAQPTQDMNLVPGWDVQTPAGGQSGYAQPAAVPASPNLSAPLQAGAGMPQPPGLGAQADVLTNPGYADGTTQRNQTLTLPLPTLAGVQQPLGTEAIASITGAAITMIQVAPFCPTGMANATWSVAWQGTAQATPVQVNIPAAGYVKTTGGAATAVQYQPA